MSEVQHDPHAVTTFDLPKSWERVSRGPFYIRNDGYPYYPGTKPSDYAYSVVCRTAVIVTCGGQDTKERATILAKRLNGVFNRFLAGNKGPARNGRDE